MPQNPNSQTPGIFCCSFCTEGPQMFSLSSGSFSGPGSVAFSWEYMALRTDHFPSKSSLVNQVVCWGYLQDYRQNKGQINHLKVHLDMGNNCQKWQLNSGALCAICKQLNRPESLLSLEIIYSFITSRTDLLTFVTFRNSLSLVNYTYFLGLVCLIYFLSL